MARLSAQVITALEGRDIRDLVPAVGKGASPSGFGPIGPPPPLGWVRVESDDGLRFETIMDENPPKVTGGYGGWTEVERPRQTPIISWAGCPPYRMDVGIIFEGYVWDRSIEEAVGTLEKMARRDAGNREPPKVRVALPANSPRSPRVVWAIENLEWGDSVRLDIGDDEAGERARQYATISFVEFNGDELIRESPSRKRRKAAKKKKKGKK